MFCEIMGFVLSSWFYLSSFLFFLLIFYVSLFCFCFSSPSVFSDFSLFFLLSLCLLCHREERERESEKRKKTEKSGKTERGEPNKK